MEETRSASSFPTVQPSANQESMEVGCEKQKKRLTWILILTTVISACGSFQSTFNFNVINHTSWLIEAFHGNDQMNIRIFSNEGFLKFLLGLLVFIFPLGGIIGSLLSGPLLDLCGRRGTLVANNLLSIVSTALTGFSIMNLDYEIIFFSRLISGMCAGIFSCAVPIYLGEIAPENLRGGIIAVETLFSTLGLLMAQILKHDKILGTFEGLPLLLVLSGILAILAILLLPFLPESPRYLLIQKKDEEKTTAALKKLRGQDNVEDEIDELLQEEDAERTEKSINVLKLLCYPFLRWQLVSVVVIMVGQELSGISVVNHYAYTIYTAMKTDVYHIWYFIVGSTLFVITTLIILIFVIDSVGRRIPLLIGFFICSIFSILLTTSLKLQATISWMPYISIACIYIFLVGHAMGPGPIPNVIIAEMFLQSSRSSGFVVAGFVHWFFNFIVSVVLLATDQRLEPYSFLVFCIFSIATFIYIAKVIPETKKKTFLEIKRLMAIQLGRSSKTLRAENQVFRRRSTRKSIRRSRRRSTMKS